MGNYVERLSLYMIDASLHQSPYKCLKELYLNSY